MGPAKLSSLEKRLGYAFANQKLLLRSLTHRSAGAEHNERLEFLGDAGLGLVVADLLFQRYPQVREHELTIMRASLVNKKALAERARELELGVYLNLGSGEWKSGAWGRDSILADTFEALLGAVYLDGGYKALYRVLESCLAGALDILTPETSKDAKTRLQEVLQARHAPLPVYLVVVQQGQEHNRRYEVECRITKPEVVTRAIASSRREAEKLCAALALKQLEQAYD